MAPTPSDEPSLGHEQRRALLQVAAESIAHGLTAGAPLRVRAASYDQPLRQRRASFVTLERDGELRGCIGMLEARRALVVDVAENAFAAAFRDPRFPPVTAAEAGRVDLHISVLGPASAMSFRDEPDLLAQLRPGVDGLILEDAGHRGTFLPAVWEQLPDPRAFWSHLKVKAGLSPDHWSESLRVWRYTTDSIR